MNKLEKIRDVIDEALIAKGLDSTRALKFGCKVFLTHSAFNCSKYTVTKTDIAHGSGKVYLSERDDWTIIENITIIGRDITLEDVLLAMAQTIKANGDIHPEVHFHSVETIELLSKYGDAIWQLGKLLHEQSEATIAFIYKLLI